MSPTETFQQLCRHTRETAVLGSIQSLLSWDERTQMPLAAGEFRAEQMKLLAGLLHQRQVDPRVGQWLDKLADSDLVADPHSDAGATVRKLRRQFERQSKLPQSLVEALTVASVRGQQAWVEARRDDRFATFAPHLTTMIDLKREEAAALGGDDCLYDPLLDDYEPGATTVDVARVLRQLRDELTPLVQQIAASGRQAPIEILERSFPSGAQQQVGREAAELIGFRFDRGRLDVTAHPFCCEVGPDDCRITTRYDERFFPSAFFGTLHEAGHGLYEQGLRREQYGLPPGLACSLGIHESQSRLWENFVGRGLPFWKHFYPRLQRAFPAALGDTSLDDFYFAVNDVRPSLIRVEADEATYNLHIILRFELEQALLGGDVEVADLPTAWREAYRRALAVEPPSDADGVLQDIHWSAGLIGYFPTYSLGNLYAAQLYAQADADLGGLDAQLARGETQPLLDWLRTNIHQAGQCYSAAELLERATGQTLAPTALLKHLRGKLAPLYGL